MPYHRYLTLNHISALGLTLTRQCNLGCIYCCFPDRKNPPDKLTLSEIKSVILQAREAGARRIVIPGEGEPFLDENIFSVIGFSVGLGMKVRIFTNGLLIDHSVARDLLRSGVFLTVKLHALDATTYDRLAGKKNAAEWECCSHMPQGLEGMKIPKGLCCLLEAGYMGSRRFPWEESPLQIESVITRHNIGHLLDIARCCKKWGTDFRVETLIRAGKVTNEFSKLSVDQMIQDALFKKLRQILGWRFVLMQKIRCTFETNPFLDISGNIRHCFGLPAEIGNIRDAPLLELHRREINLRIKQGLISLPFSFGNNGFRYCATRKFLDAFGNS